MMNDLRSDPSWNPEIARWDCDGWGVQLWAEPCLPGFDTFDDYLVAHRGRDTRIAVLDAVVNMAHPSPAATAHRGLSVARRHFRAVDAGPEQAMLRASAELCDPALRPRNRNSTLTAAIADLHPDGTVDLCVSADSEVWVRTRQGWSAPLAGDMLTEEARAAWEASVPSDGSLAPEVVSATQESLLDEPAAWALPPIGLLPGPRVSSATLSGVLEVIVSTDGARLTQERCADLERWLTYGVQQRPAGSIHPSPHGDITVLHAVRTAG